MDVKGLKSLPRHTNPGALHVQVHNRSLNQQLLVQRPLFHLRITKHPQ
jgi:hypothetical protein